MRNEPLVVDISTVLPRPLNSNFIHPLLYNYPSVSLDSWTTGLARTTAFHRYHPRLPLRTHGRSRRGPWTSAVSPRPPSHPVPYHRAPTSGSSQANTYYFQNLTEPSPRIPFAPFDTQRLADSLSRRARTPGTSDRIGAHALRETPSARRYLFENGEKRARFFEQTYRLPQEQPTGASQFVSQPCSSLIVANSDPTRTFLATASAAIPGPTDLTHGLDNSSTRTRNPSEPIWSLAGRRCGPAAHFPAPSGSYLA